MKLCNCSGRPGRRNDRPAFAGIERAISGQVISIYEMSPRIHLNTTPVDGAMVVNGRGSVASIMVPFIEEELKKGIQKTVLENSWFQGVKSECNETSAPIAIIRARMLRSVTARSAARWSTGAFLTSNAARRGMQKGGAK